MVGVPSHDGGNTITVIQIDSGMKIYIRKEIAVIASWETFRFYVSSLLNAQKQCTNITGLIRVNVFMYCNKEIFVVFCTQVLYYRLSNRIVPKATHYTCTCKG